MKKKKKKGLDAADLNLLPPKRKSLMENVVDTVKEITVHKPPAVVRKEPTKTSPISRDGEENA